MATSFVEATVTGPKGGAAVEFLIDSGATYSVLPMTTWQTLGLVPKRSIRLRLADGTAIERHVSECRFALEDADGTSPVVLGDANDAALLGVVTLETLGLVFNPFTRTLHPMQMLMA